MRETGATFAIPVNMHAESWLTVREREREKKKNAYSNNQKQRN